MVETLRMFEAIKEAEMAESDSSSGSESDEQKSIELDNGNASTDDEAPREEKIKKRVLSDNEEEPSGSHKK
jgi:hypothetical protein